MRFHGRKFLRFRGARDHGAVLEGLAHAGFVANELALFADQVGFVPDFGVVGVVEFIVRGVGVVTFGV